MKRVLIVLVLITAVKLSGQTTLGTTWLGGLGGINNDKLKAMTLDANGNILLAGSASATVDFDFGPGTYTLNSLTDHCFFSKYNSSGAMIWARQFLGSGSSAAVGISTDGTGNVYLAGTFTGIVDFDPVNPGTNTLSPISSTDMFIAKYDVNGSFQWVKQINGPGDNINPTAIKSDSQSNIIVVGSFVSISQPVEFNPAGPSYTLNSLAGAYDIFVAKYNPSGVLQWAFGVGDTQNDYVYDVTVDATDNIYIGGEFQLSPDFNPLGTPTQSTSSGGSDMYFAKYAPSGILSWVSTIGGGGSDDGVFKINLDNNSNLVVAGYLSSSTIDADPSANSFTLLKEGSSTMDMFLGKYSTTTGGLIWAKNTGGSGLAYPYGLATDNSNNIYLTGPFVTGMDFDFVASSSYTLSAITTGGFPDVYLGKYDSNGNIILIQQFGGGSNNGNEGDFVKINSTNDIYLGGMYANTVNFDPIATNTLQVYGMQDIFINKYYQCVTADTPTLSGTSFSVCSNGVATVSVTAGNLNTNTNWVWSALSCGSFSTGVGNTFTASPVVPTTYYVRGEGGCATPGNCASLTIVPVSSKDLTGNVSESSNPVPGLVVLYNYKGNLTKWDSITYQNVNALGEYTMNAVNEGTYVIQAIPSDATLQVTYAPNSTTWKGANVFYHGCINTSTQNIAVVPLTNPNAGPGILSGKVVEGVGYGQRSMAPGNPIGGLMVKGGKNPGGSYSAQGRTNAAGEYTLTGLDTTLANESYFIFVDIPGLDTNGTYHLAINTGSLQYSNLDFIVDSDYVRPASGVGLHEFTYNTKRFKFYPNPTSDYIIINSSTDHRDMNVALFDATGKQLIKKTIPYHSTMETYRLELGELPKGIYFISISSGELVKPEKLIIR